MPRYLTPASVLQEPSASFLGTVISVVALIGKAVSGKATGVSNHLVN